MKKITLEHAYILHSRRYRETSLLLDVFTRNYGRISVIARGVRQRRSSLRGVLQMFSPLLINGGGKRELLYLNNAEIEKAVPPLLGNALCCGFYLNELLTRLLPRDDPCPGLFYSYQESLTCLREQKNLERPLRMFEMSLLAELGYGVQLHRETEHNQFVQSEQYYAFYPNVGLQAISNNSIDKDLPHVFLGAHLLALHQQQFHEPEVLHAAKRLTRLALQPLLGPAPIKSRELFVSHYD